MPPSAFTERDDGLEAVGKKTAQNVQTPGKRAAATGEIPNPSLHRRTAEGSPEGNPVGAFRTDTPG